MITGFNATDELFKNPKAVIDPQVVEEAFHHTDGAFYEVMRNVMVWQHPEPHQRVRSLVWRAFTPKAMERWRPIAEQVTNELCDRVEARRRSGARRAVQLRAPVQRDRAHPRSAREEPDRLDVKRDVGHHIAFSFGAYYCIGASLGCTEIDVAVSTLLQRFPEICPASDQFEWRNTLQLRGPKTLDVTW